MHAISHERKFAPSRDLNRYARGRAQAVASLLGVPADQVEAEVVDFMRSGIAPDVTLDRVVLEAVR